MRTARVLGSCRFRVDRWASLRAFGQLIADAAARHGVLVRGVGDTVMMCPPQISTEADIMAMTSRFLDGYQDALTKA
jgi:adenosylmethionine-8-amino-7-oxononanoate aminotransferase